MGILFNYQLGLAFTIVISLDMASMLLWLIGRKEHIRKWRKRHKGQRWWAYRLWLISALVKTGLLYAVIADWLHHSGNI